MRRSGNRFSNLARPLLATCVGCDRDQVTSGTWTRWWSRSRANVCPCGGLSIVRNQGDKAAALKLMRKLLRKQRFAPSVLVTNKLLSYGAARHEIATLAA